MNDFFPEALDAETRDLLAKNARVAMESFGTLVDQKTQKKTLYRVDGLAEALQNDIFEYVDNAPRINVGTEFEQTTWLVVLGPRQAGKSLCAELAFYPKAAFSAGWDHLTLADNKERADYLHNRTQMNHTEWPEEVRAYTKAHNETRRLTFAHGGQMRVGSGKSAAAGVGQSIDSFHGSELFLWDDLATQMSFLLPAMQNRDEALAVWEATPGTSMEPSTEAWRDVCRAGKKREGRWIYAFHPFWVSHLNRRPWTKGDRLSVEEAKLMEKYGPLGMTEENIAFRRFTMANDPKIRRNPDLFGVYFPSDDHSCWLVSAGTFIPRHAIEARQHFLIPDNGFDYQEFHAPKPDSVYIIGVDPSGYGSDHSAFEVFEVFAEEVRQVAEFGGNVAPLEFNRMLEKTARRYNNALVAVERNGVGLGCIEALKILEYPNIYYGHDKKPGIHKRSHDQVIEAIVDLLLDKAILHSEDLFDQLVDYRGDKAIEKSVKSLILNAGRKDPKRRSRHHFDKVAAFGMVALGLPALPVRFLPRADVLQDNVIPFHQRTYNEQREHFAAQKNPQDGRTGYKKTSRYRRRRRK